MYIRYIMHNILNTLSVRYKLYRHNQLIKKLRQKNKHVLILKITRFKHTHKYNNVMLYYSIL